MVRKLLLCCIALVGSLRLASAQTANQPNEGAALTHDAVTDSYSLSWWGRAGMTYFIQHSDDLLTWEYLPVIESGSNDVIEWGFQSSADKFFLRLKLTDISTGNPSTADFDGDGVSNYDELLNGTDPLDFYNGVTPSLAIVSGDNQSGLRSTFLPQALVVQVTGPNAAPLPNVPLTFTAGTGALLGLSSTNGNPLSGTLNVPTQFDGKATVFCYAPSVAGTFTVSVAGTALGPGISTLFHETTTGDAIQPPSAPTNVVERWIGPKTMEWTWTDASDNESEFIIERQNANGDWVEIGRVGPNTTTFRYTIPD